MNRLMMWIEEIYFPYQNFNRKNSKATTEKYHEDLIGKPPEEGGKNQGR